MQLKQAGRSVMVELKETGEGDSAEPGLVQADGSGTANSLATQSGPPPMVEEPPVAALEPRCQRRDACGRNSESGDSCALADALRDVKQILRAADEGFDERRRGFFRIGGVRAGVPRKKGSSGLNGIGRGGLRVFPVRRCINRAFPVKRENPRPLSRNLSKCGRANLSKKPAAAANPSLPT